MKSRVTAPVVLISLLLSYLLRPSLHAQTGAYITPEEGPSSAIDAKGVRHRGSDYPKKLSPWILDQVRSVAPEYSYYDRLKQHEGEGLFRLTLDLKTGAVTSVSIAKSTGFATLDNSAITSLRQWRWKPGKWRQIEIPVTFALSTSPRPPPGSIRLPRS
jgi:protein TonB